MTRRVLIWCALLLLAVSAAARSPEGLLTIIRTPNNGVPVVVTPGQSFEAVLSEKAELQLVGGEITKPLKAAWSEIPGAMKAECVVPPDTPAGTYALEAVVGERRDVNTRAVFVRESFPPYYVIAHITDTHIGSKRTARPPEDTLRGLLALVNQTAATDPTVALVFITGDLTDGGTPEQFKAFTDALDVSALPTFVCPGNHDRDKLAYENVFGPLAYLVRFGEDGYIVFDTKDYETAPEVTDQDADLEIFRRAIKGCRWSIGISHRYEPNMGMRSQIILFLDDPLDHLFFGHWHRENTAEERVVPWGATPMTVTPAGVNGAMRFIDVSPLGIMPREVLKNAVPTR